MMQLKAASAPPSNLTKMQQRKLQAKLKEGSMSKQAAKDMGLEVDVEGPSFLSQLRGIWWAFMPFILVAYFFGAMLSLRIFRTMIYNMVGDVGEAPSADANDDDSEGAAGIMVTFWATAETCARATIGLKFQDVAMVAVMSSFLTKAMMDEDDEDDVLDEDDTQTPAPSAPTSAAASPVSTVLMRSPRCLLLSS